jgi:predicted AlkP superfamily phosphohydrolase/phosphomutase
MGPNYSGVHLLDEILRRLENPQRAIQPQEVNKTLNFLKQFKWLRQIKKSLLKSTPNPQGKSKQASDKSHRQCFQVPSSEAYGGIRLNLIGREPQGRIQPGQEYEAFCQGMIQDLSDIVNANTGEPVIRQIFRSKDLYQGEQPNGHPDLLVEWNRNAPITAVYSPKIGKVEKVYWDSRTGDHKAGGLFIALGESIKPMQVEQPTSILDFAPTLASLLQVELPNADGKAIAL